VRGSHAWIALHTISLVKMVMPAVPEDMPKVPTQESPSAVDGVTSEMEGELRSFGAELIQRAAVLLRVGQMAAVGACVLLQRFYCRRSFAEFNVRHTAIAALALACKLEETHRKLQDVIIVFHRLQMRSLHRNGGGDVDPLFTCGPTPALDTSSKEFTDMKKEAVRAERHILQELGFEVALFLDHPHKYLLQYVKSLKLSGKLMQKAWNYLNDSLRTAVCCSHQPNEIAVASIYLAARTSHVKLPTNPPWWEVLDTSAENMRHIAEMVMTPYQKPPARYIHVPKRKHPESAPPLAPFTPAADTPAPARSPSDEDRLGATNDECDASTAACQDGTLDAGRIEEMIDERTLVEDVAKTVPLVVPVPSQKPIGFDEPVDVVKPEEESKRKKVVEREKEKGRDREKRKDRRTRDRERDRNLARHCDRRKARERRSRSSSSSSDQGSCECSISHRRSRSRAHGNGRKCRGLRRAGTREKHVRQRASSSSSSSCSSRKRRPVRRRNTSKSCVDECDL